MEWWVEDPTPILFAGIVAELVLALVFAHTRRPGVLAAMIGVLFLVGAAVLVERFVVTEREAVEQTLDGAAGALVAGDLARVYTYVSPSANYTRERAAWALDRVDFYAIKLRNMEIEINRLTNPPVAQARFRAVFRFRDRLDEFPYNSYELGFTVELEKIGDRWLVSDHVEHHEVLQR